ncbi:MAG: hypothetical protein ACR2IJ_06245, partial [Fluviibacter sp.]
ATLLDSSLAVRATTAWVKASIFDSSDIQGFLYGNRRLNCEAVFDERLDDFTQHIGRLPVLLHLDVKFLVTVGRHPYSQKLGFGLDCHDLFPDRLHKVYHGVLRLCNGFENKSQKEKAPVVRPGLWRRDTMKKLATAITSEGIL